MLLLFLLSFSSLFCAQDAHRLKISRSHLDASVLPLSAQDVQKISRSHLDASVLPHQVDERMREQYLDTISKVYSGSGAGWGGILMNREKAYRELFYDGGPWDTQCCPPHLSLMYAALKRNFMGFRHDRGSCFFNGFVMSLMSALSALAALCRHAEMIGGDDEDMDMMSLYAGSCFSCITCGLACCSCSLLEPKCRKLVIGYLSNPNNWQSRSCCGPRAPDPMSEHAKMR